MALKILHNSTLSVFKTVPDSPKIQSTCGRNDLLIRRSNVKSAYQFTPAPPGVVHKSSIKEKDEQEIFLSFPSMF